MNVWPAVRLSDVAAISYGYTASASAERVGPKFLRITDIQNGGVDWDSVPYARIHSSEIERYRLNEGDIVFARTGATTGKSFLIISPPDAIFASYLIRLRLSEGARFVPRFVSLFFQTEEYWSAIREGSSGSAQGGFNATKLGALHIPQPPIAEQRRIVAILDKAFESIAIARANAEKNLQNARELFDGLLATLFRPGREGWCERSLEQVVAERCSLSYGIVQPGDESPGGLPVVRPVDLTRRVVGLDGLKRIRKEAAESYQRTELRGGELLLCVRGTPGTVAMASPELKGANVTRGIVPIAFNPALLDPGFGYYLMSSEPVQEQIRAKTYGAALMQINIRDLRAIRIAFPGLSEQRAITEQLDRAFAETQRLKSIYQRKLAVLDELKQSLLHQAFSGQL